MVGSEVLESDPPIFQSNIWSSAGSLLFLPYDANQIKRPIPDNIPRLSGKGFANGAYLRFGKGRIVIFTSNPQFPFHLYRFRFLSASPDHYKISIHHYIVCTGYTFLNVPIVHLGDNNSIVPTFFHFSNTTCFHQFSFHFYMC
ncbi:hypothetical protein D3C87_326780 [compost metagenome]